MTAHVSSARLRRTQLCPVKTLAPACMRIAIVITLWFDFGMAQTVTCAPFRASAGEVQRLAAIFNRLYAIAVAEATERLVRFIALVAYLRQKLFALCRLLSIPGVP